MAGSDLCIVLSVHWNVLCVIVQNRYSAKGRALWRLIQNLHTAFKRSHNQNYSSAPKDSVKLEHMCVVYGSDSTPANGTEIVYVYVSVIWPIRPSLSFNILTTGQSVPEYKSNILPKHIVPCHLRFCVIFNEREILSDVFTRSFTGRGQCSNSARALDLAHLITRHR